jgi:hypothetical protein
LKSLKQEPIKCHEGEGGRNNFQNTNFSVFSRRRAAVVSPQPSPAHVEGQPKIEPNQNNSKAIIKPSQPTVKRLVAASSSGRIPSVSKSHWGDLVACHDYSVAWNSRFDGIVLQNCCPLLRQSSYVSVIVLQFS